MAQLGGTRKYESVDAHPQRQTAILAALVNSETWMSRQDVAKATRSDFNTGSLCRLLEYKQLIEVERDKGRLFYRATRLGKSVAAGQTVDSSATQRSRRLPTEEAPKQREKPPDSKGEFVVEATEGMKKEAKYLVRGRNRNLRDSAFKIANGVCSVCGRDFSNLLDGRGTRALQVHHRKHLSAFEMPTVTTLEDLAVVCANCHCLLHLNPKQALKVEDLKAMLKSENYP